jgi:hypothetical protein
MVATDDQGDKVVTVLPVTHTPPFSPALAVEIPFVTKGRLGLDVERSWVALSEANRFVWPRPDLRMKQAGDAASVAYGLLPRALFLEIRREFVEAIMARRVSHTPRTE